MRWAVGADGESRFAKGTSPRLGGGRSRELPLGGDSATQQRGVGSIAAPIGTPIYTPDCEVVLDAGLANGCRVAVYIQHRTASVPSTGTAIKPSWRPVSGSPSRQPRPVHRPHVHIETRTGGLYPNRVNPASGWPHVASPSAAPGAPREESGRVKLGSARRAAARRGPRSRESFPGIDPRGMRRIPFLLVLLVTSREAGRPRS